METLTAKILDYLKGQSFQVAVVFAAVLILTWLLRNRSAHIRYLLWLLVAIKCLTPPMMIFSVPVLPNNTRTIMELPMTVEVSPQTAAQESFAVPTPEKTRIIPMQLTEAPKISPLKQFISAPANILLCIWAAGGAFYLLWAAIKAFRLQLWLRQNHRPVGPHLAGEIEELTRLWNPNRAFTVRLLDNVSQPFVWGLWRGAIYLPSRIQSIQTDRQKAVVMHEMAHVIRWDSLLNLIQILIQGLFWFHPLVWLANRFIRQEREKCCDETAIARLNTQPKEYGSAIIETLVQEYHNAIPIPSLAVAGPIKNIEDRIKTIMQPGRRFFRRPSIVALLIIGCLAVLVVPTTIALTQQNMPSNHIVSGTVTDAQTGAPIAGAEVFDDGYNDNKGRTMTGADGKFELKTWNEEHFISAGAKGYESHKQLLKTFPFANNKNFNFQLKKSEAGIDFVPADLDLRLDSKRQTCYLVVSIPNHGKAVLPKMNLRFYRGDPKQNLDEAGNISHGWNIAGPIEPGKTWNERTSDFHLSDGQYEFNAVLDYDNAVAETDETNNAVALQIKIINGQIAEKKVSLPSRQAIQSPQQAGNPDAPFAATLPDGMTVELLGICEHPSKGKRWWKPDGTFLEQSPYSSDQVKAKVSDWFKPGYEFAVLVENPSGRDVGFEEFTIHGSGSSSVGSFPRGNHSRLNWFITSLPGNLTSSDIKLRMSNDQWIVFKNVSLKPDLKTDVKIEIEKPTAGDQPPTVGVVMTPWEKLLKEKENETCFIDFDTRQITTQVYGVNLKDEESVKKWVRDNGYDAVVKFGEHPQLIGYDTAYLLIGSDEWENMSAVYLDELTKQKQLDAVPYHNGQKEYMKYAIRTREGAIGWLRMATIDDQHPQSMVFEFNKLNDEYVKTKLAAFRKEQGMARLSFHILPNKEAVGQYSPMLSQEQIADFRMQLRTNGPAYGAAQKDVYRWLKSDHPQRPLPSEAITEEYSGMRYVLVCNWRPRAMLSGSQYPENWSLTKVEMVTDTSGHPAIQFELDEVGQEQMAMITGQADHLGRSMAIVLNGDVIAAPRIQSKLSKQGMIVGSFTEDEVRQIVDQLKTSPQYKPSEKEKPDVKTETDLLSAGVQPPVETQNSDTSVMRPDDRKWAFALTVIDKQTGKPIGDVELGVSTGGERVKAATDKNGGHTVELDTAPSSFCIYAKKEGFVPMKLYWRQPPFPNDYTLALEAGTSIGGIIRDEQGSPIEGVTVYLLVPGKKDEEARPDIWDYEVKTDSKGRWRCDIMPARLDDVWIRLAHPDFVGDDTYGMTPKPSIEKLRDMTGVMIMKKGVTVTGQVRDANGKPVKDAKVAQGSDRWGSHYPSTTTDGQGNFTFDNAKTGSMILTVQAAGFSPDLKEITVFKTMPPVKFRLLPGNIIKGQLVDARGNPVEGAFVTADTWRGHRSIEWDVRTDKDGRFQWNEAPSDEVLFDMGKTGFTYIRKHSMTPSKGDYLLTLHSALKISGKVIDAKTNEPIKQFQLQSGIDWGNNQPVYWEQRNIKTFNNGVYEITFDEPRGCLLQVTAQGYRPAVSPCYKNIGGDITFNFELVEETWISGIVKLPDGADAAGAKVILCTPSQPGHIENGRNIQTSFSPFVETNTEGRFSLPPQTERYLLVVLHDRGCAEVSDKQLKTSSLITLQPWGRIEGTLRIGSGPGKNEGITIWRESPYASGEPRVFYQSETTTDNDGHFVLERIKAGSASVGRKIKTSDRRTSSSHGISVEVKSGETAAVSIGGTGRPVIGKVAVPADFNQPVDWSYAEASIRTKNENTIKKDLQGLYQSLFSEQAVGGNSGSYAVIIDPDGSFHAEDIPEGEYEINISLYEPLPAKSGVSESIASLRKELKIAAMPGGRSDEPLDVGTLMLKVDNRPKAEKVIEKAQTTSNQQHVTSAKEQVEPPTAILDNPKFKKRSFVTLIADKDNNISSDGQKVAFEQLNATLSKNPNLSHTVLEVAFEPGALPKEAQDELSQGKTPWRWLGQNPVWQKAGQLVQKYHFEYHAFIGEDKPESRREPLSIRMEDVFVMDKDIPVAMPALSLQEDKPLLTVNAIRFAGGEPGLAAKLDLAVISHPQRRWLVKMRLLDKDGRQLDSVVKYYQNSGIIKGVAAVSKELLFFNFSKRDLSTIAKFEIELRQTKNVPGQKTEAKIETQNSSVSSAGAATLEFRVVPDVGKNIREGELKKYRDILETKGPDGNFDGYKWVAANTTDDTAWYSSLPSHRYKNAVYILLYDQPDKQMLADGTWGLQKVSVDTANQNFPSILAEFDDEGGSLFQSLTQQNIDQRLALIVDGKVISAPQVKSPISKQVVITGNFANQELAYLTQALIKGMPPAGPKVTVEARFILADEAVLKQAGIDLNKTRGTVTTLPADSNDITDLFKNNSLKNMILESSEPNLLIDSQSKSLMEWVRYSKNSTTLTAPKVLVRNNEYAAIQVSTNTEYFDAADNRKKTFKKEIQLTVCPQVNDTGKNVAVKLRVLMSDLLKPDTQQAPASVPQAQVLDISYQTTVPNETSFWLLAPQGFFEPLSQGEVVSILEGVYKPKSQSDTASAIKRYLLILIKPTITTSEEQTTSPQSFGGMGGGGGGMGGGMGGGTNKSN